MKKSANSIFEMILRLNAIGDCQIGSKVAYNDGVNTFTCILESVSLGERLPVCNIRDVKTGKLKGIYSTSLVELISQPF